MNKTDKEIELEKDVERLSNRNAKLEKMLYIAVKALKFYAIGNHYEDDRAYDCYRILEYGETAEKALAKISEVEK